MVFFTRLRCHFCGTRSPYTKSSGMLEFHCASCEAVNYMDGQGNMVDNTAGADVGQTAQAQQYHREQRPRFRTFTQPLPDSLKHQKSQAFCTTCLHNQRFVMEALSNYLPDEDSPDCAKYEAALPQYKDELERRYPQVCRKCAPKAQENIHKADYYAATQNINRISRDTTRGARQRRGRDDWGKWCMRWVMNVLGLTLYVSLAMQTAWHVHGMLLAGQRRSSELAGEDDGLVFDLMWRECLRDATRVRFNSSCHQVLASYIPGALIASACLMWYNPRLADWWHHTYRIEAITGQVEHFRLQVLMLCIRTIAYWKLSDPAAAADFSTQQTIAAHGSVVALMLVTTWLSHRAVKSVKFKLKQKMMPKPEQRDVLGAFAGPESESYEKHASSVPPSQLFARDHISPFPIANLAPRQTDTRSRPSSAAIPSPPPSDETDDDSEGDPMDVDTAPLANLSQVPGTKSNLTYRPTRPQKHSTPTNNTRSLYSKGTTQGLVWSSMRDSLFGIEDNLQVEQPGKQQKAEAKATLRFQPPVAQSLFRGRLPQAPMSMERRLRNPPTQVSFRKAPLSKQQGFLSQMRAGIEDGKQFGRQQEAARQWDSSGPCLDDTDDDLSPAKQTRPISRGVDLTPGKWHLPADFKQTTGLEDLFGGSFKIAEPEPASSAIAAQRADADRFLGWSVGVAVLAVIVAFAVDLGGVRRVSCLWLVTRLERWGV